MSIRLDIVKPDNSQRTLDIQAATVNAVLTTVSSGSRSNLITVPWRRVSNSGLWFDRARMANNARRLICGLRKENKTRPQKRYKEEYTNCHWLFMWKQAVKAWLNSGDNVFIRCYDEVVQCQADTWYFSTFKVLYCISDSIPRFLHELTLRSVLTSMTLNSWFIGIISEQKRYPGIWHVNPHTYPCCLQEWPILLSSIFPPASAKFMAWGKAKPKASGARNPALTDIEQYSNMTRHSLQWLCNQQRSTLQSTKKGKRHKQVEV